MVTILLYNSINAQNSTNIEIKFSKNTLEIGEYFVIAVEIYNPQNNFSPVFPSISGLEKSTLSTKQQTTIINGKKSSSLTFTQSYQTVTSGKFVLKPFVIKSGKSTASHNGLTIVVRKPAGFDDSNFLEYTISKKSCAVGESFRLQLNFWYDSQNANRLNFSTNTAMEIEEIKQKIKSEMVYIQEMPKMDLKNKTINGINYSGTRIIDFVIMPKSSGSLVFDQAKISLLKGSKNGLLEKTYLSNPKSIQVLALPQNIDQNSIIGAYITGSSVSKGKLNTSQETIVEFKIKGEGNLPFLPDFILQQNDSLLIILNNEKLSLDLNQGMMKGEKIISYSIVPQIPGKYDLNKYLGFTFYNFKTKKIEKINIDTKLEVGGKNLLQLSGNTIATASNETPAIQHNDSNSWQIVQLSEENRFLTVFKPSQQGNLIINLLLLLSLLAIGFLLYKSYFPNKN